MGNGPNKVAMSDRRINQWPHWPDARGWVGISVFVITIMILRMMKDDALREDEFFQTIATMIITSGFLAVVAWAYGATKGGGELADKNAAIVAESATATVVKDALNGDPQKVEVVQPPDNPVVPVVQADVASDEDLPDYARG
jgi:hypothetical protein